jgi:hypothetical protein
MKETLTAELISKLPVELLNRYQQLDELRIFFESYLGKFSDEYTYMQNRIGKIIENIYNISDEMSEIIGQEIGICLFNKEDSAYLLEKGGEA